MKEQRFDNVLLLLVGLIVFFTLVLFSAEIWFNNDSQLFQVVAQLLSGISGAFLIRIKPPDGKPGKDGADAAPTTVSVVQENK